MKQNVEKSVTNCLNILVARFSDIKVSIPRAHRQDNILRDKIFNALKDVNTCHLAYQKPAETLLRIISDLHASVATKITDACRVSDPLSNFADRRYQLKEITRENNGKGRSVSFAELWFVGPQIILSTDCLQHCASTKPSNNLSWMSKIVRLNRTMVTIRNCWMKWKALSPTWLPSKTIWLAKINLNHRLRSLWPQEMLIISIHLPPNFKSQPLLIFSPGNCVIRSDKTKRYFTVLWWIQVQLEVVLQLKDNNLHTADM